MSAADCSLLARGHPGYLPMRAGDTVFPFGTFLNLAHSFRTHRTVMFMDSAMILFAAPFSLRRYVLDFGLFWFFRDAHPATSNAAPPL